MLALLADLSAGRDREVTDMNKNIILCGVGGQGTVLASKLIAASAMEKGLKVMSAETIGMAQRGGNVFSNIRISDEAEMYAPMRPSACFLS